jgi:putative hydrolase of the HAD superfamily
MIQAIVFDMGGVLVHDHGTRARLLEFDQMLGWQPGTLHQRLFSGPAWIAHSTGRLDTDAYWAEVGADIEPHLPPDFTCFKDNFWGATLDLATVELAWRLQKRYRIALLSNATPLFPQHLAQEPRLQELFDVTVISALEGMRKPDPAIYHLTGQRLQLPLSACVLIDDKARNTIAARTEGMLAIEYHDALATEHALRQMGVVSG